MYMNIPRKILICLSLLSLALFSCSFISRAEAISPDTSLFFAVADKTFNKGDEVNIDIKVRTPDQIINAISGSFKIPAEKFKLESIETDGSIIDFWVHEPKILDDSVSFGGVAIKKPYQGAGGLIFSIRGIAITAGVVSFNFDSGTILANDGLGTNLLNSLQSLSLFIKDLSPVANNPIIPATPAAPQIIPPNNVLNIIPVRAIIPPVITSIPPSINQSQSFSLAGKGMPNALTKIQFQDISEPSFGKNILRSLIRDRVQLSDVEVKNDNNGVFSYVSPKNLVAGIYNVVPSYINLDKAESVIGYSVKVFITDNTLSQILIIIINAMVLIIPIVSLILIIIFLPWYFKKELHVISKKMELEEEKIDVEEQNLIQENVQRKKIQ